MQSRASHFPTVPSTNPFPEESELGADLWWARGGLLVVQSRGGELG